MRHTVGNDYFCVMSEVKIPKKTALLISQLQDANETVVVQAIQTLEAEGNEHVIAPLFACYQSAKSDKIIDKIQTFFNNLSDSSATPEVIELLRGELTGEERLMLLGSCWQNKLDFTAYLPDFVAMATEGTFLEAFECLTVIENLEGQFQETQILESQLYLKEYLENEKGKDRQKDEVISEITLLIKDFDRSIEA